ncbi:hypothetical protein A3C18_01275 [Candidatus Kaiserbacteria bacterium RIFCSPHIGHO2_02_FULL_54_11b]|uniref:Uncharacterized protein n=2 Tax=Candidatus Kaiseribacteriota TaxID=1752734 RepID=A0A1F6CQZ2_9BACT|nr:MAG: hypothetical protein A2704_06700 [Candidatus Kaiserbacteria bacterium RIFCSPHIGHO2_01_FULL_54_36b]OGG64591.1 MAG: hypothetical protein A3C18_01275 [Candidatus Kaiserbacteria bacterium RIFCSPHIGHO2_02_FULL_54_11b]
MNLTLGLHGLPATLEAGDMMVYNKAQRRIMILRGEAVLHFAGGTFDTFLVPQADDGFGLASVVSYVTGMPFQTREHRGMRAFLFEERDAPASGYERYLEKKYLPEGTG